MQVRLLLSRQRSGSHFLKSFIESRFSGVVCSGEVLEKPADTQSPVLPAHPEISRFWSWYAREAAAGHISAAPDQRLAAFEFYLRHLVWLTKPNDLVIDVKYNCVRSLSGYEDTDHGSTDFTTFLRCAQIPVLHLIRENILKMVVSHELARQSGIWHRTHEKDSTEKLPRFPLDPARVLRAIAQSDRLTRDYQEHFIDYPGYEEVVYEDLVREQHLGPAATSLQIVTHFLGRKPLASAASDVWCRKTTPDDPAEVVENWDEIVAVLRDTEYAWMAQSPALAPA
jgi:LPS sulfotransferase NodH